MLTFSSVISFYCNTNFTYQNIWTLTLVSPKNLAPLSVINLSTNPTSQSSELVIKENSLAYGLYMFQFQVLVSFNGMSQISSNVAVTYMKIIPTGLAVFGIANGVSYVLIGTNQLFSLQPSVYSMDLDNIVVSSQLNFAYFCKTVNLSDPNSVNTPASQIDLLSYNTNQAVLNWNQDCFVNSSNNLFIKINPKIYNKVFFVLDCKSIICLKKVG